MWAGALLLLLTAGQTDFEKSVAPLLVRQCLGCHGGSDPKGDFDLTSADKAGEALQGGLQGKLWEKVSSGEMPPKEKGQSRNLNEKEMEIMRGWLARGAPWPKGQTLDPLEKTTENKAGRDWWAFQPLGKMAPPLPGLHPVDSFLQKKTAEKNLPLAPRASKEQLARRLFHDLIGLPPPQEILEDYLADTSRPAWEKLVDRLLHDPRHGERWARHWLDLVRYADTNGYERDADKPFAWKYRDYVIQSLNAGKPYDQFIVEQLAGDELPDARDETLAATGMLRAGAWDDEPNDKLEYKYDRLEDLVHVTATAFLGLTIKCARCHDHKFDPVTQVDYYKFGSAFWAGDLMGNAGIKPGEKELLVWKDLNSKPEPLRALKKGDPRKPLKEVAPGFLSVFKQLDGPFPPSTSALTTGRRLQLAGRIVHPGNPLTPRAAVNRVWQKIFGQGLVRTPDNFGFKGDLPSHPELLDWLARAFQQNGGSMKSLIRLLVTSEAYARASTFPGEKEWEKFDPDNRLLWKMNRKRRDAESLRDSLLAVSGDLNSRMGGPGYLPNLSADALEGLSRKGGAWKESPPLEQNRRTIYMHLKRSLIPPMLTTFDFCDTTLPCAQRDQTLVAPQALTLLNNEFMHKRSQGLARRVKEKAGEGLEAQVRGAWIFILGRPPAAAEELAAQKFLKGKETPGALAALCHVLLNTNEFYFID
ncbi:MAG: DUF1553 domain-containing protein [Gemmataceae bacterium]|nr:DUF1553 domain-containing protein [Gemmataceae bacterium]